MPEPLPEPRFDLRKVPFSRFGAYLAISRMDKPDRDRPPGLYLRTMNGDCWGNREVMRLRLEGPDGPLAEGGVEEVATPGRLDLRAAAGTVSICMPEPRVLRLEGRGVGLSLELFPGAADYALPAAGGRWDVNVRSINSKFMFSPLDGRLEVDSPWEVQRATRLVIHLAPDPKSGRWECALEEYSQAWAPRGYAGSFDDCAEAVAGEFAAWAGRMPPVPGEYRAAAALAAYVDWSAVVEPDGHFRRPAMLMSKHYMMNIWSWDNCFNAMALAQAHPDLAWDQLMYLVDHQHPTGGFVDSMNNRFKGYCFNKPPIHGWTLAWMLDRTDWIGRKRLSEIYGPLCRWTDWWFAYRDYDGDGIPQYNHGNDSGWDNCSLFSEGPPIEGPDLGAYLVVQMDALAEVARRLGKAKEAAAWEARSDAFLQRFLKHSWDGEKFIAPRSGDHKLSDGDALLVYLPLVLGKRLPPKVRARLVADLKEEGRFLTAHGLATESPRSKYYQPDGYWRGPIWAPTTFIIVDGLWRAGERDFAREVARRFCDTCAASGFHENFDSLTGKGLRDPAYTWTASVFLILAQGYLDGKPRAGKR